MKVLIFAVFLALLIPATSSLADRNEPPQIVTGTVFFTKQILDADADETHSVVVGDLDGDGDHDAAATEYVDGAVYWYENDGNGGFVTHVLDGDLGGAYPSAIADVDQDGDPDVLVCGYLADTIVWYENDGSANFTRHDVDTNANGAHSVVVEDMDRDGDNDLLTTTQDSGRVQWYENDGNLNFTLHTIDFNAWGAKRAEFADLDGDEDFDVVAASNYGNEFAWYENDGNQEFTKHLIDTTPDGPYYVFPADMDGDLDLDVLTASQWDHTVALYLNDGDGGFTKQVIDNDARGARTVMAVDLDRDGDLDPVAASPDDDKVSWYRNLGDGTFTKEPVDLEADGAYGIFLIDFENDGDVDVLSSSRDAYTVALHHQIQLHNVQLTTQGAFLVIDPSYLEAIDPDDPPGDLTYTITAAPAAGELLLDGVVVPEGGSFTQLDVNNLRLAYQHNQALGSIDAFSFTLADGGEGGVQPASGRFVLQVVDPWFGRQDHWPLDAAAGFVAEDIAGEYDGTVVGDPTWQPDGGRLGGALRFGGVDGLVDIGGVDLLGGHEATIALWVRPEDFQSDSRLVSKATGTAEQDHFWMVSTYNGRMLRFRLKTAGVTSTLIAEQEVLELDQWYHVACVYGQNEMRIYGDGGLLASLAKTGPIDLDPSVLAAIGNQPPDAGDKPFAGLIDDVRLYGRALLPEEIGVLANPEPIGVGLPDDGIGTGTIPGGFALYPNVPNPFNPATAIGYRLPHSSRVSLRIFDLTGRFVRSLVNETIQGAGDHRIVWRGVDEAGRAVGSGTYMYRLEAGDYRETGRMVLIR